MSIVLLEIPKVLPTYLGELRVLGQPCFLPFLLLFSNSIDTRFMIPSEVISQPY